MPFVFLFLGTMQEERQQDPKKWKCLKGLMGCLRQAIANPVKQSEPSKEKTQGTQNGQKPSSPGLSFSLLF